MDRDKNRELNKFEIEQPLLIVEGSDEIYFLCLFKIFERIIS